HAVDRRNHWLVEVAQLLKTAKAADAVVAVDRVTCGGRFQVPTGGKELVAGGGDDGDAQRRIVAESLEGLAHEPAGSEIDGVGFGTVERHLEDATLATRADNLRHRCTSGRRGHRRQR